MASSASGIGRAIPNIGASTSSAIEALAVPLASHCTLRPQKTTTGLVGAAMSSGRVPARRSHVVPATTNADSSTAIRTALPISRYRTVSGESSSRPIRAKNATWASTRDNHPTVQLRQVYIVPKSANPVAAANRRIVSVLRARCPASSSGFTRTPLCRWHGRG